MIPRVNGVVLLAHLPDWGQAPKTERRWQSAIASSLAGVEERAALRQTPIRTLNWRVTPFDAAERGSLDDRLRVALLEGAAATLWWGRGLKVTEASGTTVTVADSVPAEWVPEVGSHIAFFGPWATAGGAAWEVAEIEAVSDRTLTLSESLAGTWSGECWEVFSGTLSVRGGEAMTDHTGPVDLRIEGVRGVVETYGYATPPATECPADSYMVPDLDDELNPVIERVPVIDANLLSLFHQVQVTTEAANADQASAVWEWADFAAGLESATWATETSAVRETADPTLWRVGMKYRQAYYLRVTITTFGTALTSDPIVIPGLYPERMMRVLQERREDTGGAPFAWPYSAPAYPADGFFDSTIASLGNTAHATILSALRTAIRTTGFLSRFLNPWSGTVVGGTFGRYIPRANAFNSTWALTPGSGFTLPAYEPVHPETYLSTAITTSNWGAWWDDIARICLWTYKRFYRNTALQSAGELVASKRGIASQSSGDMKPVILASGGLGEQAQDAFDISSGIASSVPGVRTTINPTSVSTFPWGQTYNAPGDVRMEYIQGHWLDRLRFDLGPELGILIKPGQISMYRAAYYTGYGLESIGVVGQDGVTPYHPNAGLGDVYYSGYGAPLNMPEQASTTPGLSAHTPFTHQGTIPFDGGEAGIVYELEVASGLDSDPVSFLWFDVFNTTSRPLRNLGVEMVCYSVWYRSPRPGDQLFGRSISWTHTIHQPVTP